MLGSVSPFKLLQLFSLSDHIGSPNSEESKGEERDCRVAEVATDFFFYWLKYGQVHFDFM